MDGRSCVVCRNEVTLGNSTLHRKCKHRTHNKCLDMGRLDFAQCAACKGEVDLSVPLLPDEEPGSLSGADYIENPLPPAIGVLKKLGRLASGATKANSDDPHFLLSLGPKQCPMDWLIREKRLGLQRFLEERVTLDDFFSNGYTWDHLLLFKDIDGDNPLRTKQALVALQVKPRHIQQKLLGLDRPWFAPREMVEVLGMQFPGGNGPIRCPEGHAWYADQLLELGWKAADLFGAGMETIEQYEALKPTQEDDAKFGMTAHDFELLSPVVEPQKEAEVAAQAQPVIHIHQHVVTVPPKRKLHHGLRKKK